MKRLSLLFLLLVASAGFAAEQKHSWFDTELPKMSGDKPTRFWPVDGSPYEGFECVISNTAAGTVVEGSVVIDADTPMRVCPYAEDHLTEARRANSIAIEDDHTADIYALMKMSPFRSSELPAVPEGTKTAVIAVDDGNATNFWVTAGSDTLFWTNTMIAADVTRALPVSVQLHTNDLNATTTEWMLDGSPFVCDVVKVGQVNGVAFAGHGELVDCYGDKDVDVTFVSFYLDPIADEVVVFMANAAGEELRPNDIGDYEIRAGREVFVTYSLPEGWVFYDGDTVKYESFVPTDGANKPLYVDEDVYGILDLDIGPANSWMVTVPDEDDTLLVLSRHADLEEAVLYLKDGYLLFDCYSELGHTIDIAPDGKSVKVDGETYSAKDRYLYVNDGSEDYPLIMLTIDPAEAAITSFGEDPEDPTRMIVGSVEDSYADFLYSVVWGDDLEFSSGLGECEQVCGDGGKLELKAPKGDGDKDVRYYRIRVEEK